MIELREAITKELLEVYRAIALSTNVYEKACLSSGAVSLEWVLRKVGEIDDRTHSY